MLRLFGLLGVLMLVSSSLQCSFSPQEKRCPEPLQLTGKNFLKMFSAVDLSVCQEKCCEENCRTLVLTQEHTCYLFKCGDCDFPQNDDCQVFQNQNCTLSEDTSPVDTMMLMPNIHVQEQPKDEGKNPEEEQKNPEEEQKTEPEVQKNPEEEKNPEAEEKTTEADVQKIDAEEQKKDTSVCSLPSVVGLCRAAFPRFFFNSESKKCERFIYGGCGGNGNNFETEDECRKSCEGGESETQILVQVQTLKSAKELTEEEFTEHCKAPSVVGPCRAAFQRWFYDDSTGDCTNFIYGGCKGNKNNYESKEECESHCKGGRIQMSRRPIVLSELNEDDKAHCGVSADPGPCRAAFPMFYFNVDSQSCEGFLYGGCKGNENRYDDKEKCEERCSNIGTAEGRGHGRNRWTAAFFLFLTLAAISFLLLTALIIFTMRRNRFQNQPRRALSIRSDKEGLLPDSDSLDSLPLPESPTKP